MQHTPTHGVSTSHRKVVLVVDDEVELLAALRLALEPKGFDVVAVSNPFTAVRIAATRRPDLIVMDLDMPGMDGAEAARHLKRIEETRLIPIIAFTGRPLQSIDAVERSGFHRVFEKTHGFEPLETHIDALIAPDAAGAPVD